MSAKTMTQEQEYYAVYKTGKKKKVLESLGEFRDALRDYMPSKIWWDDFDKDLPYIEGNYADGMFSGAFVKQAFLTFELHNLKQLQNVFRKGMYIYV